MIGHFKLRHRLQFLIVISFVEAMAIIGVFMLLYFRGQWMQQTDAITKELAAGCAQVREMLVENRESISEIRRQLAEDKVNQ